jgi:uracil phosphoribosyltransferase
MKGVTIVSHPLVQHSLTRLRDKRTGHEDFRRALGQAGVFLVYEALHALAVKRINVRTPLKVTRGTAIERELVLVPVLRAGLGFLHAVLPFIPEARVGFIGLSRDEQTLQAKQYHRSLGENLRRSEVVLLDPMLATGGSTAAALDMLKERGARSLRVVNLVAAPEGIRRVQKAHPGIPIYVASVDQRLNEKGYIVPGLGDAGFRLFGV